MNRRPPISRQTQSGVTLVEILVVLALLGVMTGAVALSLGRTAGTPSASAEADLLVARLNLAADEIVLTSIPMQFAWGEDGYAFQVKDGDGGWDAHPISVLGEDHVLPTGVFLRSDSGGGSVTVDADLIPAPREVLVLQLSEGDGQQIEVRFDGVSAAVIEGET